MRAAVLGMVLLCGIAQGAEPKTVTNTIGMELIEIPAGKFMMGSPAGEKGRNQLLNEDQVAVTLTKSFWLGKTEVTQGQWKQVMGTEPWKGEDCVQIDKDCPATYVSWDDAVEFCDLLTDLERKAGKISTKRSYRLPTAAEWEYACRAGTKTTYSFGNDEKQLGEYAWFRGNTAGEEYAHKVGLKKPNPWGLHDMHGNVIEWCSDWYSYTKLSGGTDPVGPKRDSSQRVLRGGGRPDGPDFSRSAQGRGNMPEDCFCGLGFRVARCQLAQ